MVEKITSRVIHMSPWSHGVSAYVSVRKGKQDGALQQWSLLALNFSVHVCVCVHARNLETAALFGIFCQRLSCTLSA